MSTEKSMRKAFESLDEAAGAAPTRDAVFGDEFDNKEHFQSDPEEPEDDPQAAEDAEDDHNGV